MLGFGVLVSGEWVEGTNQPAAFESVLDSIRGVSTQGFFFLNCVMFMVVKETRSAASRRPEWLMVL